MISGFEALCSKFFPALSTEFYYTFTIAGCHFPFFFPCWQSELKNKKSDFENVWEFKPVYD